MKRLNALLVYPQLGSQDDVLRDIPLSLIYAATDSVKAGYRVEILDLRLAPTTWRQQVDEHLRGGCDLVGLSVMTGNPIRTALEVSRYVKEKHGVTVVWGGPHPTILPEQTLENPYIDYVIRDWGSKALHGLLSFLDGGRVAKEQVLGLGYKENGRTFLAPVQCAFEQLDYHDLPYHLVEITGRNYNRLSNGQTVFPIFTALGCPYKCTFCMSPAVYGKIRGKKWIAQDVDEVLGHIEYLLRRFDFRRLVVYDDDSFVDLDRMHRILTEFVRRGHHERLKVDFRGVRVNELDQMDEDYVALLTRANVEIMAIGAESGSDRTLQLMNKKITVEQTLRVNRKLARYPGLRPHYNLFCGVPGETLEDLEKSRDLILRLVDENPYCYVGIGADWKPLPGSVMTEDAVNNYGLQLPECLEDWADIDNLDTSGRPSYPWYTRKMDRMIRLLQVGGFVLDRKLEDFRENLGGVSGWLLYHAALTYRPILRFRLKHNLTAWVPEHRIRNAILRNFTKFLRKAG